MRAAIATLLAVLLLATPAMAEPDARRAQARRFFDAGTQAYDSGQYEVALRAYEAANAVLPKAGTVFSMAQAARLAFFEVRDPALLHRALELYQDYLRQAPAGRRRAHAVQHIASIEAMFALAGQDHAPEQSKAKAIKRDETMLLVVSRTPNARARIDDGELEPVPLAQTVSPGPHRVEVVARGYFADRSEWPAIDGRLVVAPVALRPRPATLRLTAPRDAALTLDGHPVGTASKDWSLAPGRHQLIVTARGHEPYARVFEATPGQAIEVDVELEITMWRRASHWLFGGAGGLALGAGVSAAVAVAAERQALSVESSIGRVDLAEEDRAEHQAAARRRDVARSVAIGLGIGAATMAGTGLVIYLADAPEGSGSSEQTLAVTSRGLSWRMTF